MRSLTKWLIIVGVLFPLAGSAQLTLEQAYETARSNYPLIRQRALIEKTAGINIENLRKGFLPQVVLSGQASYQSDVTEVKIPVPGISIEPLSKDQYKLLADVSQTVYDGGVNKEQRQLQQLSATVEQQKLEVELYKLKERISALFLGILFYDEQLKQIELVRNDIINGIKKVEAQVNNGVAFRSNLVVLEAELLKTDQRVIEINASREGMISALSLFLNQSLSPNTRFIMPVMPASTATEPTIARPELQLFTAQDRFFDRQARLVDAKNLPKASLFFQGGYGRPGLNFLNNDFDLFYIGGVRLNWSLGGFYTQKKEKELVEVSRKMSEAQKETFLLNTRSSLTQQHAEITKLQRLLESDDQIIQLRTKVKDAAKAQLDNGVITANDYLREVNAEDLARQTRIAHQLQLLQAHINYQTISGN
jgi:outer membrane protein TolC